MCRRFSRRSPRIASSAAVSPRPRITRRSSPSSRAASQSRSDNRMNATVRARLGIGGALTARLRQPFARWARRRQGEDRLPAAVSARRIYILPTRGGMAYAALVFVMLLAGLNYSNSIAMIITFLLAGFGLIAMHLTHRNLVGTLVHGIGSVDAFAGEHARLFVTLENSADTTRIGLECSTDDSGVALIDV